MPQVKVLFADDQIPDENLPANDDDLRKALQNAHPSWPEEFINSFVVMRMAVKSLRDAGHGVIVARTFRQAMELASSPQFDIAIIDLGWYADEDIPSSRRSSAGWDISTAIDKAERPVAQIIYSNRFVDNPEIGIRAASQGKLPLFKLYTPSDHQALCAAIDFITRRLHDPSAELAGLRQLMTQYFTVPLEQQKRWFSLTFVFVAVSLALLCTAVIGVMFRDMRVGTLTSVASVITGAISSILYFQLQRSQKNLENSRAKIEEQIREMTRSMANAASSR